MRLIIIKFFSIQDFSPIFYFFLLCFFLFCFCDQLADVFREQLSVCWLLNRVKLVWLPPSRLLLQSSLFFIWVGYLNTIDIPAISIAVLSIVLAHSYVVKRLVLLWNETSSTRLSYKEVKYLSVVLLKRVHILADEGVLILTIWAALTSSDLAFKTVSFSGPIWHFHLR